MATRGFITFVVNKTEKTCYNHFDSYPDGLGLDVLRYLRECAAAGTDDHSWSDGGVNSRPAIDMIRRRAASLRVVTDTTPPTAEDIARFAQYSWDKAQHGGEKDLRDGQQWYDLLHETQGDIGRILEAGVLEDAGDFPLDSLFAEWGYVIDLDAGTLDVYKGFQHHPHTAGRFADRKPAERSAAGSYYPCAMVASFPLGGLPSDDEFMTETEIKEEDDE